MIPYSGFESSNASLSAKVRQDWDDAVRSQRSSFARGAAAWDMYKAIDGSQYSDEKRRVFKEEQRHPWQFDFASAKADTLAGSIVAELPDPSWSPISGLKTTGIEALEECYYIDKELFNFPTVLLEVIRDGCVHSGWCQIGESKKYDPLGNISLWRLRPGYFTPDPYWMTSDDRDLVRGWKHGYYNAERMKQRWKKHSDRIDKAVWELKNNVRKPVPDNLFEMQQRRDPSVGDEWLVVEYHYLEIKDTVRLVGLRNMTDMTNASRLAWIPFPVTENQNVLKKFAEINDIDWETVKELPFTKRTHKVQTVTDLDREMLLEDGDSRVQPNGLPFLHYTTTRVDGMDKGIVETISDAQMMFNERMSHVHELIGKASGGSELINEDLFKNPQEAQRFVKNSNKPGHKELLPLDDVKRIKEDMGHITVNPAIFQQVSVIYNELLPLISRVSDSMSAQASSEDTGVLYERKYQMNRIANIIFDKYAKQLMNSLGECYYYQWQITYADVEREMNSRNGKPIYLNKQTEEGIYNSATSIPRCRVIVTENPASATKQMHNRTKLQEIIKAIPPQDYLRLNFALNSYFANLDMKDEDQAAFDIIAEMNDMKAKIQFMTEVSGFKAQIAHNEVMMKQAESLIERMSQQAGMQQGQPAQSQITGPEQQSEPVKVTGGLPGMDGEEPPAIPQVSPNTIGANQRSRQRENIPAEVSV